MSSRRAYTKKSRDINFNCKYHKAPPRSIYMSVQPKKEDLRKAVKWISEIKKYEKPDATHQELVGQAALKFDLSPTDTEFLYRFLRGEIKDPGQ